DWPKWIALPDNIRQQMGAQDTPVLFSFNPSSTPHNTTGPDDFFAIAIPIFVSGATDVRPLKPGSF
ncbi:hypothetical protein E3A20_29100, partial [Planctomyces bekefii]